MAELFHWAPQERAAKSTFGDLTLQAKNPFHTNILHKNSVEERKVARKVIYQANKKNAKFTLSMMTFQEIQKTLFSC